MRSRGAESAGGARGGGAGRRPPDGLRRHGHRDAHRHLDKAKDVAAKGEILMVKTGIAAYVVTNAAAPPEATQDVLAGFVDPWPTNPWTQAPMVPGKQPGDIVYAPGAGTDYTLGVVLADGSVYNAP